ncbi:MAG TPA: hypothetical protein VMN37_02480, partial [Gemmatimonadales bacterium]|nr:hypothetical protein [Gemmatimonadales bacterium]
MSAAWLPALEFFGALKWIDGTPVLDHVEPYRRRLFTQALDTHDAAGRLAYNLVLSGRAKKNWKSADLVLAALFALVGNDSGGGNDVFLFGNDEEQAGADLALVKKLVGSNPLLRERLVIKQKVVERKDGRGFMQILPAQDVAGTHGLTFRFAAFDEIHAYRTWDILEAMQLDPTRGDAQQWITSYASLYHRPGVPLFDLCAQGRAGADPWMCFSWYAADYTTDPDFAEADPETRANPSRDSWGDPDYLAQQARRLPAHKFRRLHLNLPGLPEGSAFTAESVMGAVERGVKGWGPEAGAEEVARVDMAGGSSDDATLAIARKLPDGRIAVVRILNQGPPPPYDPRQAVTRFAAVLREYGLSRVRGDAYSGETFIRDFERAGITYEVDPR